MAKQKVSFGSLLPHKKKCYKAIIYDFELMNINNLLMVECFRASRPNSSYNNPLNSHLTAEFIWFTSVPLSHMRPPNYMTSKYLCFLTQA